MKVLALKKEIRLKAGAALEADLTAMREKLRSLRFKLHGQELKNKREVANVRKDIARTMTIIKEKAGAA
jgi:ribosomal protein L29